MTQAIIFAAGQGVRMRPLTLTTPKPLLAVGDKPMLGWTCDKLRRAGVGSLCINVSYLATSFTTFFENQPDCHLSLEPSPPWETGGAVINNLSFLGPEAFWGVNGDTLWAEGDPKPLLTRMYDAWDDSSMDILLALVPRGAAYGLEGAGDYFLEEDHRLVRRTHQKEAPYFYMGIQLTHPRLYENEPLRVVSNRYFFDKAQAQGRLFGIVHTGPFFHFGTPQAYTQGVPLFLQTQNHP